MGSAACTESNSCNYNNTTDNTTTNIYGWSKFNQTGGYAQSKKCTVFRFKTPSYTGGTAANVFSKLTGTIKRRWSGSGKIRLKILTSDPTGKAMTSFSSYDQEISWKTTSAAWQDISYEITSPALKAGTIYYLAVGYGSGDGSEISAGFTATAHWTNVNVNTLRKPYITNHGNNTFSITAYEPGIGTNNAVYSATLYYQIGSETEQNTTDLASVKNKSLTCGTGVASQTIKARVVVDCKYGSDLEEKATDVVVPNYQPPALPDTPSITSVKNEGKTKKRFTIKEDWTASWPESSPANTSSGVTGYEVVLRKNNSNIYLGDTTSANRTWTIDPIELTLAPKDTIQIGVKPYTTNGAGTRLYNANYKYGPDPAITVQNAAVVRVKVGTGKNTWVEGQVWIKGSDNKWHEADVVKIKTDDGWKESE